MNSGLNAEYLAGNITSAHITLDVGLRDHDTEENERDVKFFGEI